MRRSPTLLLNNWAAFGFFVLLTLQPFSALAKEHSVQLDTVAVYFSPNGGCTKTIISEINQAKSEVLVQAYSFTSKAIAKALANAHARGVGVEIIVDKKQRYAKGSAVEYEWRLGVPVFVDHYHSAAHNKVMIIDGVTIITGSFNFTRAAEVSNAENLLILRSASLAKRYIENWNYHKEHSGEYIPRSVASP